MYVFCCVWKSIKWMYFHYMELFISVRNYTFSRIIILKLCSPPTNLTWIIRKKKCFFCIKKIIFFQDPLPMKLKLRALKDWCHLTENFNVNIISESWTWGRTVFFVNTEIEKISIFLFYHHKLLRQSPNWYMRTRLDTIYPPVPRRWGEDVIG